MGIGITDGVSDYYIQKKTIHYKGMTHEIEALIRAVRLAKSNGILRVVNDDKYLIASINNKLASRRFRSKGLSKQPRFNYLVSLLREYRIAVETPKTKKDKELIKRCHSLSRSYMKAKEPNRLD